MTMGMNKQHRPFAQRGYVDRGQSKIVTGLMWLAVLLWALIVVGSVGAFLLHVIFR